MGYWIRSFPVVRDNLCTCLFVQGVLRQALLTRLVRQTLCQWCAADLEMRRHSEISKKITHGDGEKSALDKKSTTQFPLSFMQYKVNGIIIAYQYISLFMSSYLRETRSMHCCRMMPISSIYPRNLCGLAFCQWQGCLHACAYAQRRGGRLKQ